MRPFTLIVLLLFLGGVVWVLTLSQSTVRDAQAVYYASISPLISKSEEATQFAASFTEEVHHSKELEKQLEQAVEERAKLALIATRVRELEMENNELRAALDFKQKTPFNVTGAQVTRRQPLTWAASLEINKGLDQGLRASQPVLAGNGGLIGRIHQPGPQTSTIILATYEGSMVSAQVSGTTESGILQGKRLNFGRGAGLRLRFLSRSARVRRGMEVYTDGRGQVFPANILIGTIEDFETGPVDGEATVLPAVDFSNLKTVFVITGNPEA